MERDESILLIEEAKKAYNNALATYSNYRVGAAILTEGGNIYIGCNVESSSYGLSVCAERNAISTAIARGERKFKAIAIYSDNGATPCGACRQVIWDICGNIEIYIADKNGTIKTFLTKELFPNPFDSNKLNR